MPQGVPIPKGASVGEAIPQGATVGDPKVPPTFAQRHPVLGGLVSSLPMLGATAATAADPFLAPVTAPLVYMLGKEALAPQEVAQHPYETVGKAAALGVPLPAYEGAARAYGGLSKAAARNPETTRFLGKIGGTAAGLLGGLALRNAGPEAWGFGEMGGAFMGRRMGQDFADALIASGKRRLPEAVEEAERAAPKIGRGTTISLEGATSSANPPRSQAILGRIGRGPTEATGAGSFRFTRRFADPRIETSVERELEERTRAQALLKPIMTPEESREAIQRAKVYEAIRGEAKPAAQAAGMIRSSRGLEGVPTPYEWTPARRLLRRGLKVRFPR